MLRDARNSSLLRLDKRSGRAAARARSPAAGLETPEGLEPFPASSFLGIARPVRVP
jgi:hypothetical protein